ncbi:hypothetical protein H0H92_001916, partial [Tricholoma furcatifolium]
TMIPRFYKPMNRLAMWTMMKKAMTCWMMSIIITRNLVAMNEKKKMGRTGCLRRVNSPRRIHNTCSALHRIESPSCTCSQSTIVSTHYLWSEMGDGMRKGFAEKLSSAKS